MREKDSLELEFLKEMIVVLEKQGYIDIPFCMACFEKAKENFLYNDFLNVLYENNEFEIKFKSIEKLKDGSNSINIKVLFKNYPFDREWDFSFQEHLLLIGYCNCSHNDDGYDYDKDCCGIECDWIEPKMEIANLHNKEIVYWEKTQREYWDFEKQFYKEKEKNEKSL